MLAVIQNDPEVPLGAFAGYLSEWGTGFTVIHPYRGEELPAPADVAAVIILGGAMGVHEVNLHPFLVGVKTFIRDCLDAGVPFLGICLGGQLLADVLGARVTPASSWGEKGTLAVGLTAAGKDDPLFAGVAEDFVTFQWHNDSFALPTGALLLASSAVCPNQAFRFGTRAYGLQFHPEVNRAIVGSWARWSEETAPTTDRFLADFAAREDLYRSSSRRILVNFLNIARLL